MKRILTLNSLVSAVLLTFYLSTQAASITLGQRRRIEATSTPGVEYLFEQDESSSQSSNAVTRTIPNAQRGAEPKPIAKEGFLRALSRKTLPVKVLIQQIKQRGVIFQLTASDEQEIRRAGEYLGVTALNELIDQVRNNFRPSPHSPFRITYFLLKGHSIDFFLRGGLGRWWNKELPDNLFIVPNKTHKTLSYLVRNFSDNFTAGYLNVVKDDKVHPDYRIAGSLVRQKKKVFVGSVGDVEAMMEEERVPVYMDFSPLAVSSLPDLINSLNDPKQPWRAFWIEEAFSNETPAGRNSDIERFFLFRKFIDRRDFDRLQQSTLKRFYLHITKDNLPPDFGYFELFVAEVDYGCGDSMSSYYTMDNFIGPFLTLRIAVIENIAKRPLTISNFIFQENNSTMLRKREEDEKSLDARPLQRENLFPLRVLNPGERIAVPVEMLLKNKPAESDFSHFDDANVKPKFPATLINILEREKSFSFPGGLLDRGNTVTINVESIKSILNRPQLDFTFERSYVYGPSVKIKAIEIDSNDYVVRHFDPKQVLITSAYEVGSCPYVYTYSPESRSWLSEGVVLYGVNNKSKEATDEKTLQRFDGRILIKEKDPEDSFIDSVFIRAISSDGREINLYPHDKELRFSDGTYLMLRQGEQRVVNFGLPRGFKAERYILVTKGYYIPYKQGPRRVILHPRNK